MLTKYFNWETIKKLVKELSETLGKEVIESVEYWCDSHRGFRNDKNIF